MEHAQTQIQKKSATIQRNASGRSSPRQHHEVVSSVIQSQHYFSRQCVYCNDDFESKSNFSINSKGVSVSSASDPLEEEADRVADAVVQKQSDSTLSSIEDEEESIQKTGDSLFKKDEEDEEVQRLCSECDEESEKLQTHSENVSVSSPNDPAEKHADFVADKVVNTQSNNILRQSAESSEEDDLQRVCDECEEELQAKGYDHDDGKVSASLWQRIKNVFRTGSKLSEKESDYFSRRIGYDYSQVNIHTNKQAGELAKEIHARAFAYGNHVVFAPGEFQPHTQEGQHLIAHELTHVVQQGAVQALSRTEETPNKSVAEKQPVSAIGHKIQGDFLDDAGNLAGDVWDAGAGAVSDAADAVGDVVEGAVALGADAIWALVEEDAPRALMDLINEVREKGFFGYIKEKVSEATDAVLGGLENQSGVVGTVLQTFARLATTAGTILVGLAQGNCEPLFAALRQMRDMVSELANDAWTAITDFFRPIGDFFSDLWQRFGAPIVEWFSQVAGDTWEFIQGLGRQIREWTAPVINAIRSVVSDAWDWIKDAIGIGGDVGNNEGSLSQWIKDQAQSAWDSIKTELAPVIQPIQNIITKVQEVLPLEAILNFRETVNGWLQQVAETARNMDTGEGGDVAENQDSLREILPAILTAIQNFRTTLVDTGVWVADKIGSAVDTGKQFINAIATSPIVRGIRAAFDWLSTGLDNLGNWARQTVQGLFRILGDGLVYLSQFIEPILKALRRIIEVVGNILGRLPDFLLGPIWWILPECIKNPIKNFFIEQILGRIPLFQQLVAAGDIWQRVQATALAILRQIFVDGDLMGAAWRFFREMLGLIGIPAQLLVSLVANAAQAFSDILMDPIGFIGNLLRSMWQGVSQFFSNIFTHLFGGVTGWLFGQIEEAGLTPPDIFSFRSIIGFVFELLGLTMENVWRILADHVGQPIVERIRGAIELATGAWEWISTAVTEGLPGIWRMIQERLSDLWNMVLGSVANWINSAIIQSTSRWLLSLLDATGITPIINSLIAFYRAIESFAQYLVEMLEIVNSVVSGIGEIARGNIESAANFLEQTMADSLPIVIGFLANQFGLGQLGSRIRELVESLRERVNGALDSIIGAAVRGGQAFLDMLRSGVNAVRNWWENRKSFRDSGGESHEMYFQNERGELIVESDPTPVGTFLNGLVISEDDPQKSQKDHHKTQARTVLTEIQRIKQTLSRSADDADTTQLQADLNSNMDQLATHLTPLLGGLDDSGGRLPNPLTLVTLSDDPVSTPRTPEEEQIDLNGGRQLVMLAMEQVEGTEALAGYFERIKNRLALSEVVYHTEGERTRVKLRANNEAFVDIDEPLKGDAPNLSLETSIQYTEGVSGGDRVGVGMIADPVGPNHALGSGPRDSSLSTVMGKLVTERTNRNPSKYIKGHLLNDNIGGPGTAENLFPITAEANSAHKTNVESIVKTWVNTQRFWTYYSVQVRNISENIPHPDEKNAENSVNASLVCKAYIKKADGSALNEFTETITSRYVQVPGSNHVDPNKREKGVIKSRGKSPKLSDDEFLGGREHDGDILRPSRHRDSTYQLNANLKNSLDGLDSSQRSVFNIRSAVDAYNADATTPVYLGPSRSEILLTAYQRYNEGNLTDLSDAQKGALTYVNRRAETIRNILAGASEN